jgi:hypothetical protein
MLLLEALRLFRRVMDRSGTTDVLEATAVVATHRGHMQLAARLLGAANRLRDQMGQPLAGPERADLNAALSAIQAELGDNSFGVAWDMGRALAIDAAIDSAEEELLVGTDKQPVTPVVRTPADGCA